MHLFMLYLHCSCIDAQSLIYSCVVGGKLCVLVGLHQLGRSQTSVRPLFRLTSHHYTFNSPSAKNSAVWNMCPVQMNLLRKHLLSPLLRKRPSFLLLPLETRAGCFDTCSAFGHAKPERSCCFYLEASVTSGLLQVPTKPRLLTS